MKIVQKCNRLVVVKLQAFEMKIAMHSSKETASLRLTIQKQKK
jgi:hypothetical protein